MTSLPCCHTSWLSAELSGSPDDICKAHGVIVMRLRAFPKTTSNSVILQNLCVVCSNGRNVLGRLLQAFSFRVIAYAWNPLLLCAPCQAHVQEKAHCLQQKPDLSNEDRRPPVFVSFCSLANVNHQPAERTNRALCSGGYCASPALASRATVEVPRRLLDTG